MDHMREYKKAIELSLAYYGIKPKNEDDMMEKWANVIKEKGKEAGEMHKYFLEELIR